MADNKPTLGQIASPHEVSEFHRNSDRDKSFEAQHHTLGRLRYQGSPGDHNHDGTSSAELLNNLLFTGSRSTQTALVLAQVLTALELLGATDSTTA